MSFLKLTEYANNVATFLPDNLTRQISEADVRERFLELSQSTFSMMDGSRISEYDAGTTYDEKDAVVYEGQVYRKKAPSESGVLPTVAASWEPIGTGPLSTDTTLGLVQRASDAEVASGTDTVKYVSPKGVKDAVSEFAPEVPENQIAFGNASSEITSSADFTFDSGLLSLDSATSALGVFARASSPSVATDRNLYFSKNYGAVDGQASPYFLTEDGVEIDVRKAWLNALFNITVDNGLTYDPDTSLKLGGALTADTTISTGTNAFIVQDDRVTELGIQYLGFGETDITTPGSVDYSTLAFNSLVPKKFVIDEVSNAIPSFTEGSVIFQGPSSLSEDNANFFWNDANNRLGLGGNSFGDGTNIIALFNGTSPTSVSADSFTQFSKDFLGNAGQASPFFLTEDGEEISPRDSARERFLLEFVQQLESARVITLKQAQTVEVEFLTEAFTSIAYEVRRQADVKAGTETWYQPADLTELNTWITSQSTTANIPVALGSTQWFELRVIPTFDGSWPSEVAANLWLKIKTLKQ